VSDLRFALEAVENADKGSSEGAFTPVKKYLHFTARKYKGGVRRVTYWGFYILLFARDFSYFRIFFISLWN
jgi:hypothetical protein